MSRFEGTTCDSCGASINETQVTGWAEVTFWGLGEQRRYDLCPQCAECVRGFIEKGCGRYYQKDQKRSGE